MTIEIHQLDRIGVEKTPLNTALLHFQQNPSAYRIESSLGNLASHCLEAICSGPWANGKDQEALRSIKEVLDPMVDRELAYRLRDSHASGVADTDSRNSIIQQILSEPLSYGHGAQLTQEAKSIGFKFINAHYGTQTEVLRATITACLEEILAKESPLTLDSICTALQTKLHTRNVDSSDLNPNELCLEAAYSEEFSDTFGDPRDLRDPEEAHLLADAIARELTSEQVRLLIDPLESLLGYSIRTANTDALMNLEREIDRGFFVTRQDLNDLSDLVASRLGLTSPER
jgi:hypothetical protein